MNKDFGGFIEKVIDKATSTINLLLLFAAVGIVTVIALLGTIIYLLIK